MICVTWCPLALALSFALSGHAGAASTRDQPRTEGNAAAPLALAAISPSLSAARPLAGNLNQRLLPAGVAGNVSAPLERQATARVEQLADQPTKPDSPKVLPGIVDFSANANPLAAENRGALGAETILAGAVARGDETASSRFFDRTGARQGASVVHGAGTTPRLPRLSKTAAVLTLTPAILFPFDRPAHAFPHHHFMGGSGGGADSLTAIICGWILIPIVLTGAVLAIRLLYDSFTRLLGPSPRLAASLPIQMVAAAHPSAAPRCPYCHSESGLAGEWLVSCGSCKTVHHQACWKEHGGCALLGCGSGSSERVNARAQAASRSKGFTA